MSSSVCQRPLRSRFLLRVATIALPLILGLSLLVTAQDGAKKEQPPVKVPPEPNKVSEFMRAKLNHSQLLLEGLTTENFDVIAKQAQELSLLSQAATWQVLQTQEYRDRSTEFRRAADAVTEAARKKNLDAAALAYVDVTMKCVSCHKYVRHVRMARGLRPHETRVVDVR